MVCIHHKNHISGQSSQTGHQKEAELDQKPLVNETMNPTELREKAKRLQEEANAIYQSEDRERYGDALNKLALATEAQIYANMMEGRDPDLARCISLHPKPTPPVLSDEITVRNVEGRYSFTRQLKPWERAEEKQIDRWRKKKREREETNKQPEDYSQESEVSEKREGHTTLPLSFNF